MLTHYLFIFATLISIFLYLAFRKNFSIARQVFGTFFILSVSYVFTYEYPISEIDNAVLACSLPIESALFALFITSFQKTTFPIAVQNSYIKQTLVFVLLLIVHLILLFIVYGFPWIKNTFTIDDADAVLFTLKTSKKGAGHVVFLSFAVNVMYPSIKIVVSEIVLFLSALVIASKKWECICLNIFNNKIFIAKKFLFRNLNVFLIIANLVWTSFAIMSIPVLGYEAIDIYKAYTKKPNYIESDLYKRYYVSADSVKVTFHQKKNLIFIMLESMGTEHIPNLPELKSIQNRYLSFQPGGKSIATQGWTIGSQIAKYCAVPLKFPVYDSIQRFMPNVRCMQDFLNDYGYKQLFVQGTDRKFASLGNFFETHSNIEMHDYVYFKDKVTNRSGWGIDDMTLFEELKSDISKIAKEPHPFAVYAMTMDTHWPMGFVNEKCADKERSNRKEYYIQALKCSSKYVDDFIKWSSEQEWFKNTVIVIQGDHMIPTMLRKLLQMPKSDSNFWYNVFVNTNIPQKKERDFSGFDMYPTILEMMGFDIWGHRIGLGTSLMSDEKTLLELLGAKSLDSLINFDDKMDLYFMGVLSD